MQPRTLLDLLRLPKVLVLCLLLAITMTFTACDGGEAGLEGEGIEEGVGGEEGIDEEDIEEED